MSTSKLNNRLSNNFLSRTIILLLLIGAVLVHTNYAFFTSSQRASGKRTFTITTIDSSISTLTTRQTTNTIINNKNDYHHVNTYPSIIMTKYKTNTRTTTTNLMMTKLMFNGKTKEFKAGTPLSKAVAQLGCKVVYSCRKGDCATCQVIMDGRMARCCIGKVPDAPKDKTIMIQS